MKHYVVTFVIKLVQKWGKENILQKREKEQDTVVTTCQNELFYIYLSPPIYPTLSRNVDQYRKM